MRISSSISVLSTRCLIDDIMDVSHQRVAAPVLLTRCVIDDTMEVSHR